MTYIWRYLPVGVFASFAVAAWLESLALVAILLVFWVGVIARELSRR